MKRAVAVVAALGMVFAALAIRGTFAEDGGGTSGGGSSETPNDLTIACPPEVIEACRQAFGDGAVSEQPGATLAAVEDGTIEVDAWLVSRPWAEVAQADVPAEIDSVTSTGAQSPVVIAIWSDRHDALVATGCTEEFGLKCLGEVTGQSFADLGASFPENIAVGFPNLTTMTGFDVVSGGASSYFGRDDFASNDFDNEFRAWLQDFQSDAAGTVSPFDQMLTIGPARSTAVVGLEAELRPIHERAAKRDQVDLLVTPTSSELVLVDFAGGPDASGAANDGDLLDALAEAGWRVPDHDSPVPLDPTGDAVAISVEGGDGMAVKDGVLAALRSAALQSS